MNVPGEKYMSRIEEMDKKSKKVVNGCLMPIIIVLLILKFAFDFTEDQSDYFKYHKLLHDAETINVKIASFSTGASRGEYSMVNPEGRHAIGNERVARAVGNYIGKEVKVKRLPNGGYMRDRLVFSKRMAERSFTLAAIILLGIVGKICRRLRRGCGNSSSSLIDRIQ